MPLLKNMQTEPVSRLALREPVTASPGTSLREAIVMMREPNLGCVIVVDDEQKPLGTVTEAMITQLLAQSPEALDDPVEKHLSAQWPWVKLTDPVADVLEALDAKNVRFLCVVDDDGRLCGLTGQKGLMEYVAEHFPGQAMVQRIGGKPYPVQREGA